MDKRGTRDILLTLAVFSSLFFFSYSASANLLGVGNGVIWDDSSNKYWFQDLTRFVNMNFNEQLDEISNLNATGSFSGNNWGEWRMATIYDVSDLFYNDQGSWDLPVLGRITELFTPTSSTDHWNGRAAYNLTPQSHFYHCSPVLIDNGVVDMGRRSFMTEVCGNEDYDYIRSNSLGAWVVADGTDPYPVPEPGTFWLLGGGLVIVSRLKKSHKAS